MFTSAADYPSACLVGLHSGESSNDDDFENVLAALGGLNRHAAHFAGVGAILLVVDEGDHLPCSKRRKEIAALRRESRPHRLAFISDSRLARGVITAIDWLQPPNAEQRVQAWSTIDDGIAWLEEERQERLPLRRLYDTARNAGARSSSSPPSSRA